MSNIFPAIIKLSNALVSTFGEENPINITIELTHDDFYDFYLKEVATDYRWASLGTIHEPINSFLYKGVNPIVRCEVKRNNAHAAELIKKNIENKKKEIEELTKTLQRLGEEYASV